MKYFLLICGLCMAAVGISAETGRFGWDLLWAGSWEEHKTLHNRIDVRAGFFPAGLTARGQLVDKRTFDLGLDPPLGDPANAVSGTALGLYHQKSGSRLLYGVLDERGLSARIRNPWLRSPPYAENHQPLMADVRTTASAAKKPEAYLYLSSPGLTLPFPAHFPVTVRGFGSAQCVPEGELSPAFSGGLESVLGKKAALQIEGFYTGAKLPARNNGAWFSDSPPLPARDFRLGAAALALHLPFVSLSSDWAWSETFAVGKGVYGNAGIRVQVPLRGSAGETAQASPWSLSAAADGMSECFAGRDGASPGGGFRAAGKIEWKGSRGSLFRLTTSLRAPAPGESFDRSSSGVYFRFPAPAASAANSRKFPLRVSRVSLSTGRNAEKREKISDSIDGALGLSLGLPLMPLPRALLPPAAARLKSPKAGNYPLSINLITGIKTAASAGGNEDTLSPYPFFLPDGEFASAKTGCEFAWTPGIFQFRTKWAYTAYAAKEGQWEGSISAAVRFKHGRFSVKAASPDFPDEWNCTVSWRVEK